MDLGLYFRVTWRFRYLIAAGFVLAAALATLSLARIDPAGGFPFLKYRSPETFGSTATLLVTQNDFPLGRSSVPAGADARNAGLATIYANVATSDAIRQRMLKHGRLAATDAVQAVPATSIVDQHLILPLVQIQGLSSSPRRAMIVAQRAVDALRAYVVEQQDANGIAADQRIVLQEMKRPSQVTLLEGRSKTLPIVIFITVMIAAFGLAFMLENLRPRSIRPAKQAEIRPATQVNREKVSSRSA